MAVACMNPQWWLQHIWELYQPHARQDPSRKKGSGHKIPPEKLWAIDSYRAETRYPLRMWSLIAGPCSREGPIPKRSWATWAGPDWGRKLNVGRMERTGWRGRYGSSWERDVNTIKIHYMKFSENKSTILKRTMPPPRSNISMKCPVWKVFDVFFYYTKY